MTRDSSKVVTQKWLLSVSQLGTDYCYRSDGRIAPSRHMSDVGRSEESGPAGPKATSVVVERVPHLFLGFRHVVSDIWMQPAAV